MNDIFKKYETARSLHRELTNILLLCINESNYYYCYCDNEKHKLYALLILRVFSRCQN